MAAISWRSVPENVFHRHKQAISLLLDPLGVCFNATERPAANQCFVVQAFESIDAGNDAAGVGVGYAVTNTADDSARDHFCAGHDIAWKASGIIGAPRLRQMFAHDPTPRKRDASCRRISADM